MSAMDRSGFVDYAAVGPDYSLPDPNLLRADPDAPFGVLSDPQRMTDAVDDALALPCSTLVIMEGDLARVDRYGLQVGRPPDEMMERAIPP